MSKHYLVGLKLADIKKSWQELLKQLEDEPPMCADPLTPLSAIAPPDESTVRVLYYRSTNTAAGLRIGHAQKSEPLAAEWSFAYRYLERRGKTVVAYRNGVKLAFRSIQKLRADSSLYYIFVQFQQMSSNDRTLEMIDIDANPSNRLHMYQDDWLHHPHGMMSRRNYQGYVGLCVESIQMRTSEWEAHPDWDTDEPIDVGGPSDYHSLWDAPICCNTVANIRDGKVYDGENQVIGDEHLKGAAWDAPVSPWGTRYRNGYSASSGGGLMVDMLQNQQGGHAGMMHHHGHGHHQMLAAHPHGHHQVGHPVDVEHAHAHQMHSHAPHMQQSIDPRFAHHHHGHHHQQALPPHHQNQTYEIEY